MFGFAGAHRSGKTTLAKACAEALNIPYHDASVTALMKEAGYDGVANLPIEQRIEAQEFLLKSYMKLIYNLPRPFVTDRTPLDMIGYTLAEVSMHNTSAELGDRIHSYVMDCLQATVNTFDTIIITRPLPTYTADSTKPPINSAYQWHVQFIIEGAAMKAQDYCSVATVQVDDHEERLVNTTDVMIAALKESAEIRAHVRLN